MANPALAFLAGMRGVEMNRVSKQNRAFQAENQSRVRTLWDRQDEAYEKSQLDAYRAEKAAEASLISDEISEENARAIDAAEAAGDIKTANELREQWFDGPDAKANIINELWKRQLQRDPGVGELFGLAQGQDPAAGPFVRNQKTPVSGFGIAPPSSPFAGQTFIEIDSINGNQALTEGRGAGDKDNVWSAPATLSSLYAMYGSPELIKQYQIFGVMMEELGASKPTGKMESVDTAARTGVSTSNQPASSESADRINRERASRTATAAAANEAGREATEEANRNAPRTYFDTPQERGGKEIDAAVTEATTELKALLGDESAQDLTNLLVEELQDNPESQEAAVNAAVDEFLKHNDYVAPGDTASAEYTVAARGREEERMAGLGNLAFGSPGNTRASATPRQKAAYDKAGLVSAVDRALSGMAGLGVDAFREITAGLAPSQGTVEYLKEWVGSGDSATVTGAPADTGAINAGHQEKGGPSVGESTAGSPTKQEVVDKTPGFATEGAAQSAAVSFTNNAGQGKPPPEEVYKSYMFAKAGLMSLEDVMHFKQTGQIGKSAEVKFINMGNGTLAATTSAGGVQFIKAPGGTGGAEPATVADQQGLQNYMQDVLQGIEHPGAQQRMIDAIQGAATMFGIPSTTKEGLNLRANPGVMNEIREGARLVARFNQNKIQGLIDGILAGSGGSLLDFKPGDFNLPTNPTSVMIGTVLAQNGVLGTRESTIAFLDYFQEFASAPAIRAMGEGWLKDRVSDIEPDIDRVMGEVNRSDKGTYEVEDSDGSVMFKARKGMDRHELREEYIEYIIKSVERLR